MRTEVVEPASHRRRCAQACWQPLLTGHFSSCTSASKPSFVGGCTMDAAFEKRFDGKNTRAAVEERDRWHHSYRDPDPTAEVHTQGISCAYWCSRFCG